MANPRRIEVFTAGCPLCTVTIELVRRAVSRCGCEVIERPCTEAAGFDQAKKYGIKTVPTVVVDGQIAFEGKITQAQANLLKR
jgi:hypothetical protein